MFVVKDERKLLTILSDEKDDRRTLKLARREAEFGGTTKVLLEPSHGPALANTSYLSLYGNKLTELVHVSTLSAHAHELREVNLGNNFLTVLPPAFSSLSSLEVLWLDDNLFSEFPRPVLQLLRLRVLRFSGNKITRIPKSIANLRALEELAADNNALDALPEELCTLASLRTLLVRGNRLPSLPDSLGRLASLVTLVASSNRLSSVPPSVSGLRSLRTLLLNGNAITALPAALADLSTAGVITRINLANNAIGSLPRALVDVWAPSLPAPFLAAARAVPDVADLASAGVEAGACGASAAPTAGGARALELNVESNPLVKVAADLRSRAAAAAAAAAAGPAPSDAAGEEDGAAADAMDRPQASAKKPRLDEPPAP